MFKSVKSAAASGGVLALATATFATATFAFAAPKPAATITVTDSTSGLTSATASSTSSFSSHFTASGCGFKPNDSNYELVIRGPGLYTSSLTYWPDAFPVGTNGCGSASPTWSSSGVTGFFDVYVVHSPSGNIAQAQPVSNVVTIYISYA